MDGEPDLAEAWPQGHFGTKEEADAYAADIEELAGLEGMDIPRLTVERDRRGGWNVWLWE